MPSYTTNWPTALLRAMLRATYSSGYTFNNVYLKDATTILKTRVLAGSDWNSASDGQASITGSLATSHSSNGTIDRAHMQMASLADAVTGLTVALASPAELITDDIDITAGEASNITVFRIGFAKSRGTVLLNTALRNKLTDVITGKSAAHFSANGSIKVYSGAAPASADDAPTGTLLWQKATDQTSSFTWNDAASSACTLAASLVATSEAFGSQTAVGYARLTWNFGGTDYVIQGTVGQGTGDFQFTTLESGTSMNQSTSYTLSNATIGF